MTFRDEIDVVADLNQMLTGWANYFCLGSVSGAYPLVDRHVGNRLRMWLQTKHKARSVGKKRFIDAATAFRLGLTVLGGRRGCLPWAKA